MKYDEEEGIMYITFSLVMVMGIKEAMLAERDDAVMCLAGGDWVTAKDSGVRAGPIRGQV